MVFQWFYNGIDSYYHYFTNGFLSKSLVDSYYHFWLFIVYRLFIFEFYWHVRLVWGFSSGTLDDGLGVTSSGYVKIRALGLPLDSWRTQCFQEVHFPNVKHPVNDPK